MVAPSSSSKPKNSNLVLSLLAVYIGYVIYTSLNDGSVPELQDVYWGKNDDANDDVSIQPFQIRPEDPSVLKQLNQQIDQDLNLNAKSMSHDESSDEVSGLEVVQNVVQYWKDSYKWNERVKLLNKYPHFTTVINGLKIHFQRIKSADVFEASHNATGKKPRPLLMLHGYPGSFVEFQKLVPLLLDSGKIGFPFELVIPSLPGFAYSEGSLKSGLGSTAVSQILLTLMRRLGHENFYVHGENGLGSIIATTMATVYPVNVVGIHLHQCASRHPKTLLRHLISSTFSYLLTSSEEAVRSISFYFGAGSDSEFAKPETMSIALANSPSGLLAYFLEKNSKLTNEPLNIDEVLDNVMIYWLTNSVISSSKLIVSQMIKNEQTYQLDSLVTFVPTICTNYPTSNFVQSESYLSDKYQQILRYNYVETLQSSPAVTAKNIIESFQLVEQKGFAIFDKRHTCYIGPKVEK